MPKKNRKNKNKNTTPSTSSCVLCNDVDDDWMILCDWCEKWHHFKCVGLTEAPASEFWKCPKCEEKDRKAERAEVKTPLTLSPQRPIADEDQQRQSVETEMYIPVTSSREQRQGAIRKDPNRTNRPLEYQRTPIYPDGIRDPNSNSIQRSYISTSTNRRTQIELKRLEEEEELLQQIQLEKYQIRQRYLDFKYEVLLNGNERNSSHKSKSNDATERWLTRTPEFNNKNIADGAKDEIDWDDFNRRLDALKMIPSRPQSPIVTQKNRTSSIQDVEDQQRPSPKPWIEDDFSEVREEDDSTPKSQSGVKNGKEIKNVQRPLTVIPAGETYNSPKSGHVLTRAQIASRQVVTKDLPFFHGNPEDWLIFNKRYVNSTQLCGYSDGENLDRLQRCLKGEAYDAVRDLLLDVESVPDIMSILEELFGRPELIIKRLLKKLRQLPNPKTDNLQSMVRFALDVQNFAKTVERKAMHQYLSNPILMEELVDRLPMTFKVDWAKHIVSIPDNRITLITLSDWLYKLMKALIKITELSPKESSKNENKPNKSNSERINLHQVEKPSDESKKNESPKYVDNKCKICSKNCRAVDSCVVFTSLQPTQRWKAMYDNKLCRKCLRQHGGFCKNEKVCGINGCIYKHHSLLHDDQKHKPNQEAKSSNNVVKANISGSHLSIDTKVILRIIPIKIHGNGVTLDSFAFLDDGSTTTLMDQSLADALKLNGVPKELCLIWSAHIHRREKKSQQCNVSISSMDEPNVQFKLRGVKTVEFLGIPPQRLIKEELCSKFPYLKKIPFKNYENAVPGILIGCNNPRIGIPREVVDGGDYEPVAAKTLIGWTIHGPTSKLDSNEDRQMNHYRVEECKCKHEHDESLHKSMKDYFSIDNFGVQIPAKLCTMSKDDEKAIQQIRDITKRVDSRFESGLLWRYEDFVLPESYGMARRRLECLEKNRPETIKIIDDTIAEYIQKGYARKLSKEEAADHTQRHWYLPLFTVTYPKKPDKHRMVFDAAAKVKGVSLNTMLRKGPDQLVSLVEILRRFRERLYALGGDIREMFPQIQIREEDQQCQRFLWRNGDQSKEPEVYVMRVMTFGAACSPAVAHFVKNSNAQEFSNDFPRAVEAVVKNHYMDDLMDGENSEAELIQLAKNVTKIHSHAGFEIRNFLSNSKKVMDELGSIAKTERKLINPDKEFDIERVLGMWWNVEKDTFTFSLKYLAVTRCILTGEKLPTKRELLKLLMSIFDPLGLLSHYLIQLKIIIQDVWRSDLGWDESISSPELIKSWNKWLEVLPTIEFIHVPRLLTPKLAKTETSIELHMFVDAGDNAFGAVTFLRVEDITGVDCSLIGSKSRVAPLKYLSNTRKELCGGVLGSRLAKIITEIQSRPTSFLDRLNHCVVLA